MKILKNRKFIVFITMLITILVIYIIGKLFKMNNNVNTITNKISNSIENNNIDSNENINGVTKYNNPIVPKGFKKVETARASWQLENGIPKGWNNGLVIEDDKGNQFVWVPCTNDKNDTNAVTYGRYFLKDNKLVLNSTDILTSPLNTHETFIDNDSINSKIYNSIQIYQGFYIGRYETGIANGSLESKETLQSSQEYTGWKNGTAIIKKDADVWNYITRDKAKNISENFINSDSVESSLITSYCWDTTIKWIDNYIPDFKINNEKYGNYIQLWSSTQEAQNSDFTTLKTGTNENYNVKNIYDMAGNALEFTTEIYTGYNFDGNGNKIENKYPYILRGSRFYSKDRICMYSNASGPFWGFRIILFLK